MVNFLMSISLRVWVGWLIGLIIIDQGVERTRQQSQNVYKNRDICLLVLVDLFAQTGRASNIFKKYPGLDGRERFLVKRSNWAGFNNIKPNPPTLAFPGVPYPRCSHQPKPGRRKDLSTNTLSTTTSDALLVTLFDVLIHDSK